MEQVAVPQRPPRVLGVDLVLAGWLAVACPVTVWLLTSTAADLTLARVEWAANAVCFAAAAWAARTITARTPADDPARRLWHLFTVAIGAQVLGYVIQLTATAGGGPVPLGLPATVVVNASNLVLLFALITFPIPSRSRQGTRHLWLDTGTVLVAAGVATTYAVADAPTTDTPAAVRLLTPLVILVSTFGITRIALTHRLAYRGIPGVLWLASGLTAALAAAEAERWIAAGTAGRFLALDQVSATLLFAGVRLMAHHQVIDNFTVAPRVGRQWSALPYVALAATFGVLVATRPADGAGLHWLPALVGVVVATGLVVLRQLAAFAENERLLDQLTRTLAERDDLAVALHDLAYTDALTGLPNRARFGHYLETALQDAAGGGASVALLLVDLDDFKPVNDRFGHAAGDVVLTACAARLRECVRADDLPARLGGDEFAVVLRGLGPDDAAATARRIVTALSSPVPLPHGGTAQVGASVGVAVDPDGQRTPEILLGEADTAMYAAKRAGKGRVGAR